MFVLFLSVMNKKKTEIQSNIRTFWKAFELQRENLLKNLTRPTHKWYTHNILWPMCLQYYFVFLNALHDTLGCYATGFFSSLEKKYSVFMFEIHLAQQFKTKTEKREKSSREITYIHSKMCVMDFVPQDVNTWFIHCQQTTHWIWKYRISSAFILFKWKKKTNAPSYCSTFYCAHLNYAIAKCYRCWRPFPLFFVSLDGTSAIGYVTAACLCFTKVPFLKSRFLL